MIIRLFLKLFFTALIILIIADLLYELHLNWLSHLIVKLGDDVLLLSFALLLITGLIFFGKQIVSAIKNYFSETQRAKRLLFFTLARNKYLQLLFASQKKQVVYFSRLKKEALLKKDTKKQCHLLSRAILKELKNFKNKMPETQFRQYQQAIQKAARQLKIERLLELQREISTLT